jgi:hypothetical protein
MKKFDVEYTYKTLETKTVIVYDFGNTKLHLYETKDVFNSMIMILVKDKKAMVIESPLFKDLHDELANYLNSLELEELNIMVSYHAIGATFARSGKVKFDNIYSMNGAVKYYTESGDGFASLQQLKAMLGDNFDSNIYTEASILENGTHNLAGIDYLLTETEVGFDVEIPELNIVHNHIMGHDRHTMIFRYDFLEDELNLLKKYQEKGYKMLFSSHSEVESAGDISIKINYLEDLRDTAKGSKNGTEFKEKMRAKYPNMGWQMYLDNTASLLFNEEMIAPEGVN